MAQAERQEEMDTVEKKWTGKVPYLRLIHALVDNDEVSERDNGVHCKQ